MFAIDSWLFFISGASIGSFFNVVGLRSPMRVSFLYNRSKCPRCERTLNWFELIPICSFLIQFGKCKQCRSPISPMYPLIELATGILFSWMYIHYGLTLELLGALLLLSLCIIIFVTDITYMIIPNQILLFFLPLFILYRFFYPLEVWYSSVLGALVSFLLISSIIYLSKGGMGMGDLKLLVVFGVLLGMDKVLLTFFIAVCVGSAFGLLFIISKTNSRKQAIPFAPFLGIAALVSYVYGDPLISLYLSILGI